MFISKKKLEELLVREREKVYEEESKARTMECFYRDMEGLEKRLNERIDRLADKVIPQEERENRCPFAPVHRV